MSRALIILKNSNLLQQLSYTTCLKHLRNEKIILQRTQPCLNFHSTSQVQVASKKHSKKKIVKPVIFKPKKTVIEIRHDMTVENIASSCNRTTDQVFEALEMIPDSQEYEDEHSVVSYGDIQKIIGKFGFRWKLEEKKVQKEKENKDVVKQPLPDLSAMKSRPPVVTIMGHVDHGKTTLLDSLRHSHVVDQEFGGITQHIGAFSVKTPTGQNITFLDTPGHAAFSAMRARGANVTDIVILVVAADDGVMKQTEQSIEFTNQANVPVIVAINKMDKPEANAEVVKNGLLKCGIQVEDLGGDVQSIPVSALKGTGLNELLDAVLVLSEILELKADYNGLVEASVIESKTHPGRGKLSTALIDRGTLKKGDVLVAGTAWCKVRGMFNDQGRPISKAEPGSAVEIIGWRELPHAGDTILQVKNEKRAHEVIQFRKSLKEDEKALEDARIIHEKMEQHRKDYHDKLEAKRSAGRRVGAIYKKERRKETETESSGPELAVVIKGDVDGSVEALLDALDTYQSDQCRLHIIHYGVGPITEHDVELAKSFNGVIYGFNVDCVGSAQSLANSSKVDVERHNIIYKLLDNIRDRLSKKLPLIDREEIVGQATVLELFRINEGKKKIPVAGSRCTKGTLQRKLNFRLIRNEDLLLEGPVHSLRHFKNEVESIKTDVECGIRFEDFFIEPQPGDDIICYKVVQGEQKLDWYLDF